MSCRNRVQALRKAQICPITFLKRTLAEGGRSQAVVEMIPVELSWVLESVLVQDKITISDSIRLIERLQDHGPKTSQGGAASY